MNKECRNCDMPLSKDGGCHNPYCCDPESPRSPGCYLPGTMPDGWGLRRHVAGEIVVTHKDGSGVLIKEDAESIAETLFYRMMDQVLLGK